MIYNDFKAIWGQIVGRRPKVAEGLEKARLLALDFDGTLTNNQAIHGFVRTGPGKDDVQEVEAIVRSKADSLGLNMLADAGLYHQDDENYPTIDHPVDIVILSREKSLVVTYNARKLKLKCTSSIPDDKLGKLKEEVKKRGIKLEQVVFMGNDVNDIPCMRAAGVGICVRGTSPSYVQAEADYTTANGGGDGAIREVIELLLLAKGKHPYITK